MRPLQPGRDTLTSGSSWTAWRVPLDTARGHLVLLPPSPVARPRPGRLVLASLGAPRGVGVTAVIAIARLLQARAGCPVLGCLPSPAGPRCVDAAELVDVLEDAQRRAAGSGRDLVEAWLNAAEAAAEGLDAGAEARVLLVQTGRFRADRALLEHMAALRRRGVSTAFLSVSSYGHLRGFAAGVGDAGGGGSFESLDGFVRSLTVTPGTARTVRVAVPGARTARVGGAQRAKADSGRPLVTAVRDHEPEVVLYQGPPGASSGSVEIDVEGHGPMTLQDAPDGGAALTELRAMVARAWRARLESSALRALAGEREEGVRAQRAAMGWARSAGVFDGEEEPGWLEWAWSRGRVGWGGP